MSLEGVLMGRKKDYLRLIVSVWEKRSKSDHPNFSTELFLATVVESGAKTSLCFMRRYNQEPSWVLQYLLRSQHSHLNDIPGCLRSFLSHALMASTHPFRIIGNV